MYQTNLEKNKLNPRDSSGNLITMSMPIFCHLRLFALLFHSLIICSQSGLYVLLPTSLHEIPVQGWIPEFVQKNGEQIKSFYSLLHLRIITRCFFSSVYLNNNIEVGVPLWHHRLRIWCCHCSGLVHCCDIGLNSQEFPHVAVKSKNNNNVFIMLTVVFQLLLMLGFLKFLPHSNK